MLIPGASTVEGGTATFSVSSVRSARWADAWKAQFLGASSVNPPPERDMGLHALDCRSDATAPDRVLMFRENNEL